MVKGLSISNTQRSTFNSQRSIQTVGRWTLGVECWALKVFASFVCPVLIAAAISSQEESATAHIASIEKRSGARIGLAALDTGSGKRLDYRSEERFPMCSTFKFLAAAAVLKRVDGGQEKLDRFVSYEAKDILEYAPVTKAHLKDGGMTLGALCAAAIEQSDNTAGNLLVDTIGGPVGLTNFARSIGDETTRLDSNTVSCNEVG